MNEIQNDDVDNGKEAALKKVEKIMKTDIRTDD